MPDFDFDESRKRQKTAQALIDSGYSGLSSKNEFSKSLAKTKIDLGVSAISKEQSDRVAAQKAARAKTLK